MQRQAREATGTATAAPPWLEAAHRYRARCGHFAHHDGTCDSMYPGTWRESEGRCVLPEGHEGAHLYRREDEPAPTREQAYQAEREQRKRERLERERNAKLERVLGYPG